MNFFRYTLAVLLLVSTQVYGQDNFRLVKGEVFSASSGQPLDGVNVVFRATRRGEIQTGTTSRQGTFELRVISEFPFELIFSAVGYETKVVRVTSRNVESLSVGMEDFVRELDEVEVTGQSIKTRIVEAINTPFSLDKLTLQDIKQSPTFDIYDGIGALKGVDLTVQSLLVKTVNTRGFNATNNTRFSQFIDGADNQAPGLNFAIGNIAGLSDLDIESFEIIPGAQSAQYGPGTFNGLLNIVSKNPFDYQGLDVQVKGAALGLQRVPGSNTYGSNGFSNQLDFRFAKKVNERIAFKASGAYITGDDFISNDFGDVAGDSTGHSSNPSYSGINLYGDEAGAFLLVNEGLQGFVPVFRTGYREEDLALNTVENFKANGAIHFRPDDDQEFILGLNYGKTDAMITGDNRIALRDFAVTQGRLSYTSSNLKAGFYFTTQEAGTSYDLGLLGRQLNNLVKPDGDWFNNYEKVYVFGSVFADSADHDAARGFADSGIGNDAWSAWISPEDTAAFLTAKNTLINRVGSDGARIFDRSSLYNFNASYSLDSLMNNAKLRFGLNARLYDPSSAGTIFPDSASNDITAYELGLYGTLEKELSRDLNFYGTLRLDKSEQFEPALSPLLAFKYNVGRDQVFRVTVQRAIRFPGIREQFQDQDLGARRLIGGLDEIIDFHGIRDFAITRNAIEAFNRGVETDLTPSMQFDSFLDAFIFSDALTREQAELNNLSLLSQGLVTTENLLKIRPEKVWSFEAGYKALINENLFFDVTAYYNRYTDFIGTLRLVRTQTSPLEDLLQASRQLNDISQSDEFFISTNSKELVETRGVEFNSEYNMGKFIARLNFTWSELLTTRTNDITPGFNTPKYKANLTAGHDNIVGNLGYRFTVRYRDSFLWQSSFLDGQLRSYTAVDFQLNWNFTNLNTILKVGGNNITGQQYTNHFGGPTVDTMWFASVTYSPRKN